MEETLLKCNSESSVTSVPSSSVQLSSRYDSYWCQLGRFWIPAEIERSLFEFELHETHISLTNSPIRFFHRMIILADGGKKRERGWCGESAFAGESMIAVYKRNLFKLALNGCDGSSLGPSPSIVVSVSSTGHYLGLTTQPPTPPHPPLYPPFTIHLPPTTVKATVNLTPPPSNPPQTPN